ncbi:MAG: carbohydrate kinase family protein [Oscillospiraceae bacterium]|nr:carbohydrate kinase family protein [Oscillospiraceae bacterium]
MENYDVYCYGMIAGSHSFMIEGGFLTPDEYSELSASYSFPGGETGTCATVLAALGIKVKMDGTHIGYKTAPLVREFYSGKTVDISSLTFDGNFEGLEDYVIISGDTRTPMGMFGKFFSEAYSSGTRHWNKPKEEDIIRCKAAAVDSFFWDDSDLAAEYCVKHGKPYVTIDCKYDSYIHRHSAVSVISGEGIQNNYPDMTREELFPLFQENGGGLTVITNGRKDFFYARRGGEAKRFSPFKVNAVSTLGAGDSFKAGCAYALLKGMSDDELVTFASACSAAAISRYPLQLYPPTLDEIGGIIGSRKK